MEGLFPHSSLNTTSVAYDPQKMRSNLLHMLLSCTHDMANVFISHKKDVIATDLQKPWKGNA